MHLVELEFAIVDVAIVPSKLSMSLHLTSNEWSIICACFSLHNTRNFIVSLELAFVIALVFLENTIPMHVSVLELTLILPVIVPFHLALSVL